MKKIIATFLAVSLGLSPVSSTLANARPDTQVEHVAARGKKLVEADCIAKIINNSQMFQLKTRNGFEYTIFRDNLDRPSAFKINKKTYQLRYDKNLPTKVVGVKSMDDGVETQVEGISKFVAPGANDNLLTSMPKLKMCDVNSPTKKLTTPGMVTPMDADDTGHDDMPMDTPEYWEQYGFLEVWTDEEWWREDQAPEAEAWANQAAAISRDQTRACIDRYTGCNDECDFAVNARSVSCSTGVLVWGGVLPIAAGLFGIACFGASWYHQTQCKSTCGNLSACF